MSSQDNPMLYYSKKQDFSCYGQKLALQFPHGS